jgi:hypothetical protein
MRVIAQPLAAVPGERLERVNLTSDPDAGLTTVQISADVLRSRPR